MLFGDFVFVLFLDLRGLVYFGFFVCGFVCLFGVFVVFSLFCFVGLGFGFLLHFIIVLRFPMGENE